QPADVAGDALGPLLPGQVVLLLDRGRRLGLRVVPVHLQVAELGVRDELAVKENRAADAGAESQQHDHTVAVDIRSITYFRHTGRVRVVENHDLVRLPAESFGEQRVRV